MTAELLEPLTPRAGNQARAILIDLFNHAAAKGLRPDIPAASTIPKIVKKQRKRHTLEGLKAIRDGSPRWLNDAIDLAVITAQRRGDILDMKSERMFVGAPVFPGGQPLAFFRGNDKEAKDSGQGGVQLRWRTETVDWGVYAIRFHDKSPQLNVRPNFANLDPVSGKAGEFYWVYPEGIEALGASFSTTLGNFNLAGELSTRWNQPLASTNQHALAAGEVIDNDDNPVYATGRTLHANFSWLASLEPNFIAAESSFLGEIAWNRVMSVSKNADAVDPNADRDATSLRLVFEPMYRQIFPGLDLSVPIGASYTNGASMALGTGFGADHGGDLNIGLKGNYLNTWNLGLTYTHYYGPENTFLDADNHYTFEQSLKDRDFIAFTVSRTF